MECSHAPYKRALAQAMTDTKTSNWLGHMNVVQCGIINRPVRCRNNLSPNTMYYARPNRSSYFSIFGSAYRECSTEFGLRVAKLELKRLKLANPNRVLSQEEVHYFITEGDKLLNCVSNPSESFNDNYISDLVNILLRDMTNSDVCDDQGSIGSNESMEDYDTLDIWSTTPHATDNKTAPNTVELPTDMSTQNVAHHNNNDDVQICNNTLEATVANAVANGEAKKEKDDESQ